MHDCTYASIAHQDSRGYVTALLKNLDWTSVILIVY